MIEPKIDDLLAAVDSKYSLVILSAKRARDQLLLQPARRGPGRVRAAPGRNRLLEQATRSPSRRSPKGRSTTSDPRSLRASSDPLAGRRVLLGVSGGIAAYKAAAIARLLDAAGAEVSVVLTENATRFVGPDTFAALTREPVYSSLDRPARCCTSGSRTTRTSPSSRPPPPTSSRSSRTAWPTTSCLRRCWRRRVRSCSRRRCTRGCGSTPRRGRTSRRSASAARSSWARDRRARARRRGDRAARRARGRRGRDPSVFATQDLAGRRLLITSGRRTSRSIRCASWGTVRPARWARARRRGRREGRGRHGGPGPGAIAPAGAEIVRVETAEEMRDEVLARAATSTRS